MKLIQCVVQPAKLDELINRLQAIVTGILVDVQPADGEVKPSRGP